MTEAVAPDPFPVILYRGTPVNVPLEYPIPAFARVIEAAFPPVFSMNPKGPG